MNYTFYYGPNICIKSARNLCITTVDHWIIYQVNEVVHELWLPYWYHLSLTIYSLVKYALVLGPLYNGSSCPITNSGPGWTAVLHSCTQLYARLEQNLVANWWDGHVPEQYCWSYPLSRISSTSSKSLEMILALIHITSLCVPGFVDIHFMFARIPSQVVSYRFHQD